MLELLFAKKLRTNRSKKNTDQGVAIDAAHTESLGHLAEKSPALLFQEFFDEGVDEDEELDDDVELDDESSLFEYSYVC
jgi:hypothetical protein